LDTPWRFCSIAEALASIRATNAERKCSWRDALVMTVKGNGFAGGVT
jgi:hypothetical protein